MKREALLKQRLTAQLKKDYPSYLVLLQATAGAPDRAIVGNGKTTWWEFKHGTPDFTTPGNQELTCERLARESYCRYVIWQEIDDAKRTVIVHPHEIAHRHGWRLNYEVGCKDFDMVWLVNFIVKQHQ